MCNEDGMGHDFKGDQTPILLRKDQKPKVLETQRIGLRTELESLKNKLNKGCVILCGLAIYILKYLKAKEEL